VTLALLPETAPLQRPYATTGERLTSQAYRGVAHWVGLAFGSELVIATAVLGANGTTEAGIVLALRVTACFAFPLFWLHMSATDEHSLSG